MSLSSLFIPILFLPLVLLLPTKLKSVFSLIITIILSVVSGTFAISVISFGNIHYTIGQIPVIGLLELSVDALSAFFILIINLVALLSSIFGAVYMQKYTEKPALNLHFIAFNLLHISMLLVCMVQNLLPFMLVWEVMSLSSFLLVIFESEKDDVRKAGVSYFVQMHICICLIMLGSFWLQSATGEMSFSALKIYFSQNPNMPLFLVFFLGFGMKAGFVPLHSWLPHAHPAAPSHVSALMSGVMIKMGIYGILRVCSFLQNSFYEIGIVVLIVGIITGLYGIMNAIAQNDIKKSLAYSSIENIGIIGMGMGLGLIGMGVENYSLGFLGFAGALLHVLNHALFKPLLFFGAGSVYATTHTKLMDNLGGLMKKMPVTGILFLIGSLAICGLPPFNGFVSEFLIYNGIVGEFNKGNVTIDILLVLSLFGLALIGGLAIFSFTKVFGIVFLGTPRTHLHEEPKEVSFFMLLPQLIIVVIILSISIFPSLYLSFVTIAVNVVAPVAIAIPQKHVDTLQNLSTITLIFIGITCVVFGIRTYMTRRNGESVGATWGCGYLAGDSKVQYTSFSYAESFEKLVGPIINMKTLFKEIPSNDIFPHNRDFKTTTKDLIEVAVFMKPIMIFQKFIKKLGVVQSGNTQAYVIYSFLFIVILFAITLLDII